MHACSLECTMSWRVSRWGLHLFLQRGAARAGGDRRAARRNAGAAGQAGRTRRSCRHGAVRLDITACKHPGASP